MSDLLAKCSVCQGLLDEEDMFCANCGTEAPEHDHPQADRSRMSTHNFSCQGCGASMSFDASAGTLLCPFCGSERLEKQADTKVLAPEKVIPFQLNQDEAVQSMRGWLSQGFWRPGDLARQASVIKMTAVYVPYWLFEATTHTYWAADTNQLPAHASGDWRPVAGEHRGQYENLLVGASGVLTPGETAAICPFDMALAVKPDAIELDDFTVEQFRVSRKYARPLARQGLEAFEARACEIYVPGTSRNMKVNTRIEGQSSQPALLPVWIMAYRYRDKPFRFLVNGQSGKATGQAPNSFMKMGFAAGLVAILILIVLFFLAQFVG